MEAYFHVPVCQNEREPEGNSRGDTGSKHTKIVMLRDWDREREQMQKRLRGRSTKWESSSSNYQTLSIVSLPRATLQGTKCKITLLRADVDNCIRKDSKISDTLPFCFCIGRISFVMTTLSMLDQRFGLAEQFITAKPAPAIWISNRFKGSVTLTVWLLFLINVRTVHRWCISLLLETKS